MNKLVLGVAACTLPVPGFAAAKDKTFTGEIMDSQCAKNSSHAMMLKKEGMGDKDPNDPANVYQELRQDGRKVRPV